MRGRAHLHKLLGLRLRGRLDLSLGQLHWLLVHRLLGLSHHLRHLLSKLRLSLNDWLGLSLSVLVHACHLHGLGSSLGKIAGKLLHTLGLHLEVLSLSHHLRGLLLGHHLRSLLLVGTGLGELVLLGKLLRLSLRIEVLSHLLWLHLWLHR